MKALRKRVLKSSVTVLVGIVLALSLLLAVFFSFRRTPSGIEKDSAGIKEDENAPLVKETFESFIPICIDKADNSLSPEFVLKGVTFPLALKGIPSTKIPSPQGRD